MNKGEIRKKYKEIRKNIKGSVSAEFFETNAYRECQSVFLFAGFGSEIDTFRLIKKALNDKKRTALPYMTGRPHEMVFIEIDSVDRLIKNKIGISEPVFDENKIAVSDSKTLIAVPGLAFDKEGGRVGYGGGYYDKYLSENEYLAAVGLCFSVQIADELPKDEHDVNVDFVVTEKGVVQ